MRRGYVLILMRGVERARLLLYLRVISVTPRVAQMRVQARQGVADTRQIGVNAARLRSHLNMRTPMHIQRS
jgi:hypothetical protein